MVQGLPRLEVPHKASQKDGSGGQSGVSRESCGGTEVTGDDRTKGMTLGWSH